MPSPIVTATIQAAALSTASNLFAQMIEARQQNVSLSWKANLQWLSKSEVKIAIMKLSLKLIS